MNLLQRRRFSPRGAKAQRNAGDKSVFIRVHPRLSLAQKVLLNLPQKGKFSPRGAETQRNTETKSVFIRVHPRSSVAQKVLSIGATL